MSQARNIANSNNDITVVEELKTKYNTTTDTFDSINIGTTTPGTGCFEQIFINCPTTFPGTNCFDDICVTGCVTASCFVGTVSDISNHNTDNLSEGLTNLYYTSSRANTDFDTRLGTKTTDNLTEGSTNLYFTNERVDDRVGALIVGGNNITATYDDGAGTLTLDGQPGYTDADVGNYLGSGSLTNICLTGSINGPATFTIDPAAHGDNTGTVVIAGNLQVDGTTTTINSTTLTVDDKNVVLASGSANSTSSDGAGITVDLGTDGSATITYSSSNDRWEMNKSLATTVIGNITGQVSDISNHDTDALTEGSTNLYYTTTRANTDFDTRLGTKTTTDLTEGTNLYYTDSRADARVTTALNSLQLDQLSDIDASGNIINTVLTSDGDGTYSFQPAISIGDNQKVYTATGTITAGDIVSLRQDGTVEPTTLTVAGGGVTFHGHTSAPASGIPSSVTNSTREIVFHPSSGKLLAFTYGSTGSFSTIYYAIGTISNNSVSWSNWSLINNNSNTNYTNNTSNSTSLSADIDPNTGTIVLITNDTEVSTNYTKIGIHVITFDGSQASQQTYSAKNGITTSSSSYNETINCVFCDWANGGNGAWFVCCIHRGVFNYMGIIDGFVIVDPSTFAITENLNYTTSLAYRMGFLSSTNNQFMIFNGTTGFNFVKDSVNQRLIAVLQMSSANPSITARWGLGFLDVSSNAGIPSRTTTQNYVTDSSNSYTFFQQSLVIQTTRYNYLTSYNYKDTLAVAYDSVNDIIYIAGYETGVNNGYDTVIRSISVDSNNVGTILATKTLVTTPLYSTMSTSPDTVYSVALHIQDGKLFAFYELPDWSTIVQYSSFMKVDVITLDAGGTFNTSTTYNLANNTASTANTFMDFDVATLTNTDFFYKTDDRHGEIQTYSGGTSSTNATDWIGIAAEDIADAGTGKIDLYGAINRNQTGLTKDTNYYVKEDGTLATQETSYGFIGRAISTTDLQIFGKATTEFTKSIDVDFTTNTPTTTSGLVLTSDGDSTYSFQSPVTNFNALTGQISATQIPNDIITTAMMNYSVNIFSQEFTADGINNTYTLNSDPGSKNAIQVFVDGVPQRASNYTVVGTTLTLGGVPALNQIIEVRGYGVALPVGTVADDSITGAKIQDGTIDLSKIAPGDYYSADTFTGDGNTASYTLSTDPGSPWAITVYVAGVWQKPVTNYTTVGTTITFSSNVPNGEEIYVRYYGVSIAVGTVADDSITGAKIQDGTITADKIAGSEYLTQSFTGDGNSTDFTLSSDPGAQQALLVLIDNVIQVPVTNYTVTGTTLAFTSAPDLNADIFVRYLGLPSPLVTVADNSISTVKLQDNSITNAKLNLTYTSTQDTGDNSTVDFTIEAGHTVHDILVILDGNILPPEDYSIINGTTLRFGVAPLQDQSIDIRYLPV